jgi:hypothetical protein
MLLDFRHVFLSFPAFASHYQLELTDWNASAGV